MSFYCEALSESPGKKNSGKKPGNKYSGKSHKKSLTKMFLDSIHGTYFPQDFFSAWTFSKKLFFQRIFLAFTVYCAVV